MSKENKLVINCCLTGCKYNSACCVNPENDKCTHCTLKTIDLVLDEETGILDCAQYKYDYNKPYECMSCQLSKYGEIEVSKEPVFIEVDNIEDLFK